MNVAKAELKLHRAEDIIIIIIIIKLRLQAEHWFVSKRLCSNNREVLVRVQRLNIRFVPSDQETERKTCIRMNTWHNPVTQNSPILQPVHRKNKSTYGIGKHQAGPNAR